MAVASLTAVSTSSKRRRKSAFVLPLLSASIKLSDECASEEKPPNVTVVMDNVMANVTAAASD